MVKHRCQMESSSEAGLSPDKLGPEPVEMNMRVFIRSATEEDNWV